MQRHVLLEGLLDAGKEGVYGLLTLGAGRLSGDTQETDYGVSVIVVLQGLSPDSLLYRVSCVACSSLAFTTAATYSWVAFRASSRRAR